MNNDPSFSFGFTYKDLFELKDNYYYFKIVVVQKTDPSININVSWKFGKMFFRKFIITLNKDKKTITFYQKIGGENGDNDDGKKSHAQNDSNVLNIILIIVLFGICVILVIVIWKYCEQNKKIKNKERKNVLLDEEDAFVDFTKAEKLSPTINES